MYFFWCLVVVGVVAVGVAGVAGVMEDDELVGVTGLRTLAWCGCRGGCCRVGGGASCCGGCCWRCFGSFMRSLANALNPAGEFNPSSTLNLDSRERSLPWMVCRLFESRLLPLGRGRGTGMPSTSPAAFGLLGGDVGIFSGGREMVPF